MIIVSGTCFQAKISKNFLDNGESALRSLLIDRHCVGRDGVGDGDFRESISLHSITLEEMPYIYFVLVIIQYVIQKTQKVSEK